MRLCTIYTRFLLSAVLVSTCVLSAPSHAQDRVVKSPNDQRRYESFILPNKLRVLVVSDPTTDKAAAAMDVFVGTSSDPESRQGLAHFLEHMLFLGTEKYPRPGEYQDFISKHGGRHNAYTAFEHTNYFFDIDKDYLKPALDRFAQFFIAPLFNSEYVNREKNSVNAEYQLHKKDDDRRAYSARKKVVNPNHPFARFAIGSMDTLTDRENKKIRDELIEFYNRTYSANIMALAVLGTEPTQVLKQWAIEKFSAIRNINARPPQINEPLFAEGRLPARLNVVPLEDRRVMIVTFPISPLKKHYRSKPTRYIASLLGHEGAGSLLSLLKQKGWVETLSAGTGMDNLSEATFDISMQLTQKGVHQVADIASHIFQYLRLVENKGIANWIYEEQKKISEISFRFQEKFAPVDYVSYLTHNMQIYPVEDILRGPYAMDKYDPALIRSFLAQLTPDKALVTVNAKGVETNTKDSWFDVPYRIARTDTIIKRRWQDEAIDADLAIPEPNIFLPDNLSLKSPKEITPTPVQIKQKPRLELWFRQDETFRVPRADFFVSVRSPVANDSPKHAVLTALYVKLVNDQLNEFSYPAYLAGLTYSLYRHIRGFSVRLSGYDDKQELLLSRIAETLVAPKVDPKRLAAHKDELAQSLRNAKRERPHTQTISEVSKLLLKPHWTEEQRLAALYSLTAKDLEQFIPMLLDRIYVVALAHGNLHRTNAIKLASVLEQKLLADATPVSVPSGQVIRLPDARQYLRQLDIDHPDSAITVYVQGSDKRYATRAKVALMAQILSSPFYNELRTEKQLGYVVFATPMPLLEAPGIAFVVQSPTADPIELQNHIERFISTYVDTLAQMSEQAFTQHKNGLLAHILEKEKRLQIRTNRYWRELDMEHYKFDSREQLAAAVRSITKAEFQEFYKSLLLSKNRKGLVVRSSGTKHKAAFAAKDQGQKYIVIRDPIAFKEGKEYFPG